MTTSSPGQPSEPPDVPPPHRRRPDGEPETEIIPRRDTEIIPDPEPTPAPTENGPT